MARCDVVALVATLHATQDNIICILGHVCWNTMGVDEYLFAVPYKGMAPNRYIPS